MVKAIALQNGGFAYIDEADYEVVSRYRWYACAPDKSLPNNFYAMAKPYSGG